MSTMLTIDPEFAAMIPPMSAEERQQIKADLIAIVARLNELRALKNGCLDGTRDRSNTMSESEIHKQYVSGLITREIAILYMQPLVDLGIYENVNGEIYKNGTRVAWLIPENFQYIKSLYDAEHKTNSHHQPPQGEGATIC